MILPCTYRRPDAAAKAAIAGGKLPPGEWFLCAKAGFQRHKTWVSPWTTQPARKCGPDCGGYVANTGAAPDKPGTVPLSVVSSKADCIHFGEATGREVLCPTCSGNVRLKTFGCAVHGECTPAKKAEGVACCQGCNERQTPPIPEADIQRIDPDRLNYGPAGARFNSSLIRYHGRLILAYRTGWAGARIHLAELDEQLTPGPSTTLHHLGHPRAAVGQEDPRLFVYRDRLHVSFTGVERVGGGIATNVLYARLTDDFKVEEVFAPSYHGRRSWEKNWVFFEWEGLLLAVYSVAPHVILHVRGNTAYPFSETPCEFPWSGGVLRGGASPVRIGDRFYHWFHGRDGSWSNGTYNVGCYSFETKPPFRITAMSPRPLLEGDHDTLPDDQKRAGNPAVVFPCGAFLDGSEWKVSMGTHDRWTDIARFSAREVDEYLGLDHDAEVALPGRVCLDLSAANRND